jgi:hypothetical protein
MADSTVTYELYVKRSGRWTIESVFVEHERDVALLTAKRRSGLAGVEAVKLVREAYSAKTRLSMEAVIFNSSRAASAGRSEFGILERRGFAPAMA